MEDDFDGQPPFPLVLTPLAADRTSRIQAETDSDSALDSPAAALLSRPSYDFSKCSAIRIGQSGERC